jgi:hypothetical protein
MTSRARFLAGDLVEVKSASEIAATLDAEGRLEGVPFMPEMARFCGQRLKVVRRADKTCVEGWGLRRMRGVVHLDEARCDGAEHDGCQRRCRIFWKEAWLRPVSSEPRVSAPTDSAEDHARLRLQAAPVRAGELYNCQSTALAAASGPMPAWDLSHLVRDVMRGELTAGGLFAMVGRTLVNRFRRALDLPELGALVGTAARPPKGDLGLKAGDWVRVRSADEIRATLGPSGKNLGLSFEPEMASYIGRTLQVEFPVEKIILEETGRMAALTNTVALRDVVCQGKCVKNCPRANPLYWREGWLERAPIQPAE